MSSLTNIKGEGGTVGEEGKILLLCLIKYKLFSDGNFSI